MEPVIFLASLTFISYNILVLGACQGLPLVPWFVKAWSLQLLAIDIDPGAKLLPGIAHDFELSRDRQQLAR